MDVYDWIEELKETTDIIVAHLNGFNGARQKVEHVVLIDFTVIRSSIIMSTSNSS